MKHVYVNSARLTAVDIPLNSARLTNLFRAIYPNEPVNKFDYMKGYLKSTFNLIEWRTKDDAKMRLMLWSPINGISEAPKHLLHHDLKDILKGHGDSTVRGCMAVFVKKNGSVDFVVSAISPFDQIKLANVFPTQEPAKVHIH